nr:hypothetical protein TorRG33x02_105600 [Ipomoea batatas]
MAERAVWAIVEMHGKWHLNFITLISAIALLQDQTYVSTPFVQQFQYANCPVPHLLNVVFLSPREDLVTYRLTGDSERQLLAGDKRRGGSGEGREAVAGGSGLDVSGCRLSGEKRRGPRGSFRWLCGEDRDAISGDFAERTERRSPVTMVWASHIWKSRGGRCRDPPPAPGSQHAVQGRRSRIPGVWNNRFITNCSVGAKREDSSVWFQGSELSGVKGVRNHYVAEIGGRSFVLAAAGTHRHVPHGSAGGPVSLTVLAEVTGLVDIVVVVVTELGVLAITPRTRQYFIGLFKVLLILRITCLAFIVLLHCTLCFFLRILCRCLVVIARTRRGFCSDRIFATHISAFIVLMFTL